MTEAGPAAAPSRDSETRTGRRASATAVAAEAGTPRALTGERPAAALPGLSGAQAGGPLRRSGHGADRLGGQPVPDDVGQALHRRRGTGQALPPAVAQDFGSQLGVDLSGVRVHADAEADRLSRSIEATAFTSGTDVYFRAGAYSPDSPAGQHTLAHELAHVAQGPTGTAGGPVIGRADDPAEADADRVASRVVSALRRQTRAVPAPDGCGAPLPALRRQAAAVRGPHDHPPPVRRLFAYQDSNYRQDDPRIDALFQRLATLCTVPDSVLADYRAASAAADPIDLVAWLGEHGVTPRNAEQGLDEAVGLTLAELGLEAGIGNLRALARGMVELTGRPVVDMPGAPALKLGDTWYSREELLALMRSKFTGFATSPTDLAAWQAIPLGTVFTKDFEIWNKIGEIARAQATELATKAAASRPVVVADEKDEPESPAKDQPRQTTSLAGSIPQAERYEDTIGKLAASHDLSMGVAKAMSERVLAFIAEYASRRDAPNVFAKIGTDSLRTAGAVGTNPKAVEAALREGTLHERLTHVLNFGYALADLLIQPVSAEDARQAALAARFDSDQLDLLIELGNTGRTGKQRQALDDLKAAIVTRREGDVVVNADSAEQVGIPFSERERGHWGRDTPQFELGSKNVDVKADHEWVRDKQKQGFPVRSGPSTHTFELFEMTELLGLRPELSLDEIMLAATGYLLPISAHSLIEIQHVAEQFGMAPVTSPELYGRLMLALHGGMVGVEATRKDLADVLTGLVDDEERLTAAHHYLLSHGYAFVGFHGTDGDAATAIKATGFLDTGTRKADDPWRGVYVAPDVATASGYLKPSAAVVEKGKKPKKPPELLRVYAPTRVVQACIQARLPLEDSKVQREIGRRLRTGTLMPPHGDHLLLGREHAENEGEREANSLEAVLSWSAALQCVAIPSLHKEKTANKPELGLPQQVRIPEELTFEDQSSSGGLDLRSDAGGSDPRGWAPSGQYLHSNGKWDLQAYLKSSPSHAVTGPDAREAEILRKLGVRVEHGTSWAQVAEQTMQMQANASTLQELLPQLVKVPFDSPLWTDFLYRYTSAEQPSEIQPGLYLSGWKTAVDQPWQKEHVGMVLNCCQYTFDTPPGVVAERVNVAGFNNGLFEWSSEKIAAASKRGVLVHCVEGKNRSATVLAAYLMKAHRWNATRASREVVAQRPWADPDLEALIGWEQYLAEQGWVVPPPQRRGKAGSGTLGSGTAADSGKAPDVGEAPDSGRASDSGRAADSGKGEVSDSMPPAAEAEWPGQREAMLESLRTQAAQTNFASAGTAIGLDRYLTLHNSPGTRNNCLIYSLANALGLRKSDEEIAEIGGNVRHRNIGVERDGFLNAAAIPYLLGQLKADGTRVILLDTTGRVSAPQVHGVDTYSAEIVNAGGPRTVVVVNVRNVHFGYALPQGGWTPKVVGGGAVDGNHWIQFEQP